MTPMTHDLAIDLGTSTTQVFARGEGVVFDQSTVVAVDTRGNEVLTIGDEVWDLIGRTPGHIVGVHPLRRGAVVDVDLTERLLRLLLRTAGSSRLARPRVLLCVPAAVTSVERRAVQEAMRRAGASDVSLIEQSTAAAIGAGLDIQDAVGNMVVDLGGGTSEMTVLSLGGVVVHRTVRCGGADMDLAIQEHLRRHYDVVVSDRIAEQMKIAAGSACPPPPGDANGELQVEVQGRSVSTGHPLTAVLSSEEIRDVLTEQVEVVVGSVVQCLAEAPPELAQDIIHMGIHLSGGASLLRGLKERLADETQVPVVLTPAPRRCAVLGAASCFDSLDSLRGLFSAAG